MPKPTRGDQLIGPYAKPKVRCSGWAYQPGTLEVGCHEFIPLGTPAWFAWLEQRLAFRVVQVYYVAGSSQPEPLYLSYTVRPERRRRGQVYWYSYKKYHNRRLHGMYLGKAEQVTLAQLDHLALQFLAQINPALYEQICQFGLVHFRKVPQPDPAPVILP
jgi:hypothetical protein